MTTKTRPYANSVFPFKLSIEPRDQIPRWLPAATSFGAVVLALIIGGVILALAGGNPLAAYAQIARSSFGGVDVFSDTLVKATPLILVGLACTLAFRMRLWNIGAEGQFFMGAWGASAVVLLPLITPETPRWAAIALMLLASMAAGALWGFIPGWLKARYSVNEIISTLMLNYIAIAWNDFFIFGVWSEGGFQQSATFPRNAWLPRLAEYARLFRGFSGLTLHL
jgi:simple sugar transport system permease protein